MTELEMVEALLGAYAAPSVLVGFMLLKGFASVINNNIKTKNWPIAIREPLDWLASSNKKAKETGDFYVDSVLEATKEVTDKKASNLVKVLKLFS